jgi:hypothetical protein
MSLNNQPFPEKSEPDKLHGTTDNADQREKYLKDSGKIEDLPENNEVAKMKSGTGKQNRNESTHLTDDSGEEKKEDYINTDERKSDLDRRGL